jgi:hypothetical protein
MTFEQVEEVLGQEHHGLYQVPLPHQAALDEDLPYVALPV